MTDIIDIGDKNDIMGSEEDDLLQMSGDMEDGSLGQGSHMAEEQKEA